MKKLFYVFFILAVAMGTYALILEGVRLTPLDPSTLPVTPFGALVAGAFLGILAILFFLLQSQKSARAIPAKHIFWAAILLSCGVLWTAAYYPANRFSERLSIEWQHKNSITALRDFYYEFWKHEEEPTYLGVPIYQNPMDNWVMQEIIAEIKPDFIIETGTLYGGSALFYATVLEKINPEGRVISVDIDPDVELAAEYPLFQERVKVIRGDSVSDEVINQIRAIVGEGRALVTLDSDHSKQHVLKELERYSEFVSVGSYIVVQDTNTDIEMGEKANGPWGAVSEFLADRQDFEIDKKRENKYLISFYPSGYLKRIK